MARRLAAVVAASLAVAGTLPAAGAAGDIRTVPTVILRARERAVGRIIGNGDTTLFKRAADALSAIVR